MTKASEERVLKALKRWYNMKPSDFYRNVVLEKHYLDKLYLLLVEDILENDPEDTQLELKTDS